MCCNLIAATQNIVRQTKTYYWCAAQLSAHSKWKFGYTQLVFMRGCFVVSCSQTSPFTSNCHRRRLPTLMNTVSLVFVFTEEVQRLHEVVFCCFFFQQKLL